MSSQSLASRLYSLYERKALASPLYGGRVRRRRRAHVGSALIGGRRRPRHHGHGVGRSLSGGAANSYSRFVSAFSRKHRGLRGPDLFRAAAEAWRSR